ncbi:hypothetical protein J437_LFUL006216 [Ladona fulva]|uniref:C2H2-type domain-containing protein n=1 Tax=Ladona fulva TaxID=123851 RepID=A0A8K0K507_LADFU|nr:hypothetical protein J437_LFUL006216 [Ladona fulva]
MNAFLKELQRGRRLPNDPFFYDGNSACSLGKIEPIFDIDDEELCHKMIPAFPCEVAGCNETFTLLYDYEQHYNSFHRYSCKECRKIFPSPHLLDLHIMETHDTYFAVLSERKPMYQCFVEDCTSKFSNPRERRDHCIKTHRFPPDFRFDGSKKTRVKGKSKTDVRKKCPTGSKEDVHVSSMEIEENAEKNTSFPSAHATPKVKIPYGFTFGHNQERSFVKSKGSKGKHWYQIKQTQQPSKVTLEDLPDMRELMDSLPTDTDS